MVDCSYNLHPGGGGCRAAAEFPTPINGEKPSNTSNKLSSFKSSIIDIPV